MLLSCLVCSLGFWDTIPPGLFPFLVPLLRTSLSFSGPSSSCCFLKELLFTLSHVASLSPWSPTILFENSSLVVCLHLSLAPDGHLAWGVPYASQNARDCSWVYQPLPVLSYPGCLFSTGDTISIMEDQTLSHSALFSPNIWAGTKSFGASILAYSFWLVHFFHLLHSCGPSLLPRFF